MYDYCVLLLFRTTFPGQKRGRIRSREQPQIITTINFNTITNGDKHSRFKLCHTNTMTNKKLLPYTSCWCSVNSEGNKLLDELIINPTSTNETKIRDLRKKNSPAARHTGSSNLKTSPHTTSEAMAPGSQYRTQVKVAEESLSMGSLASQTPALRQIPAAIKLVRSSEGPHRLPLMTPGLQWFLHSESLRIRQDSPQRACHRSATSPW